jgi:endogenous inhibitor of DNA gyrase (YacG/DUF329 family)
MNRPTDKPAPALRAVRTTPKCPVCSKPEDGKYRPFCSKRCADIDLGRWLKESYRVPTEETLEEGETGPISGNGPTGQRP